MKYLIIFCFILLASGIFFILKVDYTQLNPVQKYLSARVYHKWDEKIKSHPAGEKAVIDYDELLSELSIFERLMVKTVFSIDPSSLGFKGPFYSKEKPLTLVKIPSAVLNVPGKKVETGVQFYPDHAYKDFLRMNNDMLQDIGKVVYIGSGYRSPGRQAYLFFKYLVTTSKYSLKENAKWIAMPGYSEHGNPVNTAMDLENAEGINGIDEGQKAEDFERLPEYRWLVSNASRYNFYLSYPRDNRFGVAFEPWHWHWGAEGR